MHSSDVIDSIGRSMSPCSNSSSSDVGGSSKKVYVSLKVCLVCGDKALGCNFNAVSCESCKAFFRRNAHKVIRGRCEGKCDVTVESRSFCKKCRLAKCFTVGMRKDMILNDEQKKERKQKIIVNKLQRQGRMSPRDTYSASPKDLLHYAPGVVPHRTDLTDAARNKKAKFSTTTKEEYHHNHQHEAGDVTQFHPGSDLEKGGHHLYPKAELKSEFPPHGGHGVGSQGHQSPPSGVSSSESPAVSYSPKQLKQQQKQQQKQQEKSKSLNPKVFPWSESQKEVGDAISKMEPDDQTIIQELRAAVDTTGFLTMSSSSLKMIPTTPEEFVNVAESFVRRVIKMAKNVSFFTRLHRQDQISLLKGSVVDIMMLRSAVNYDPFTESWSLSTKDCISNGSNKSVGERLSARLLMAGNEETRQMFMTYSKFIKSVMSIIHGDLLVLSLLIIIALFSADRTDMVEHGTVQEVQEMYARILETYIQHRFDSEKTLFARMLMKLTDLRNLNEVHSNMLLSMKMQDIEPLLLEVFEIPCPDEIPLSASSSSSSSSSSSKAPVAAGQVASPDSSCSPSPSSSSRVQCPSSSYASPMQPRSGSVVGGVDGGYASYHSGPSSSNDYR